MPIYEYRCSECGHEFELLRKMSDQSPAACAHCSSERTEQLLSLSAFHLKGSGWAHDGYGVSAAASKPSSDSES